MESFFGHVVWGSSHSEIIAGNSTGPACQLSKATRLTAVVTDARQTDSRGERGMSGWVRSGSVAFRECWQSGFSLLPTGPIGHSSPARSRPDNPRRAQPHRVGNFPCGGRTLFDHALFEPGGLPGEHDPPRTSRQRNPVRGLGPYPKWPPQVFLRPPSLPVADHGFHP